MHIDLCFVLYAGLHDTVLYCSLHDPATPCPTGYTTNKVRLSFCLEEQIHMLENTFIPFYDEN